MRKIIFLVLLILYNIPLYAQKDPLEEEKSTPLPKPTLTERNLSLSELGEPTEKEPPIWEEHKWIDDLDGALITEVIDAFDDEDPFDFMLIAGYNYELKRIKITQQCAPGQREGCVPDKSGVINYRSLFRYNQIQHIFNIEARFGLYHDLAFYTNWPLILSDSRELIWLKENQPVNIPKDRDGNDLFKIPFHSPDRSGVDWFSVGLMWAPFNQMRDPTKPTWLLQVEGRFAIGDPLKAACKSEDGSVTSNKEECPTNGGISRRVTDILFRSVLSRRFKYIEPYLGFEFIASIPDRTGDNAGLYPYYNNVDGQINTYPGFQATMLFGMEIIPWERQEKYNKFVIGLHFFGTWHSEGRDIGPLFDALGTNRNLDRDWDRDGKIDDDDEYPGERFTGLTDIESYNTFGGRLTFHFQFAKYVRLTVTTGLAHDQEHFITFTDPCNPRVSTDPNECIRYDEREGRNIYGKAFNPDSREEIDEPGYRFRAEETTIFDVNTYLTLLF